MTMMRRLLGVTHVSEDNTHITIHGIKAASIAADIMRVWSTSRIANFMFSRVSRGVVSFPKFFAPDVHFILQTILRQRSFRSPRRELLKAIDELETNTWLKQLKEEAGQILDRSKLSLFHKTPMPHQIEFFDLYESRKQRYGLMGYLLSAAAGSGKTLICLMLAEMLHADTIIMVVPKNAVHRVWSKTLKEEYVKPQEHWIAGEGQEYKGERFLITHYEALEKTHAIVRQHAKGKIVVLLDESHNMNEITANRTKIFCDLCAAVKPTDVIWSSGTPIKALGYEAIPLLRTIDPMFNNDVEERFKKIFGRDAKRALDILRARMGMISYRVDKKDVVDNNAQRKTVPVEMPSGDKYTLDNIKVEMEHFIKQRGAHYLQHAQTYERIYEEGLKQYEATIRTAEEKAAFKEYKRNIRTIREGYQAAEHGAIATACNVFEAKVIGPTLQQPLRNDFKGAKSVVKYVRLKIVGEALGGVLGKRRVQCHLDMIPHMGLPKIINDAAKKTIIFTSYVPVADAIVKYLKGEGFSPMVVHAETNKNLAAIIAQFEKDDSVECLVATYASLSTAVPLVMANVAVFTNQPFRDHEKTQAEARVDRLGQDETVYFYNMQLNTGQQPNISTRANEILEWSKQQIAAIMGQTYGGDLAMGEDGASTLESFGASLETFQAMFLPELQGEEEGDDRIGSYYEDYDWREDEVSDLGEDEISLEFFSFMRKQTKPKYHAVKYAFNRKEADIKATYCNAAWVNSQDLRTGVVPVTRATGALSPLQSDPERVVQACLAHVDAVKMLLRDARRDYDRHHDRTDAAIRVAALHKGLELETLNRTLRSWGNSGPVDQLHLPHAAFLGSMQLEKDGRSQVVVFNEGVPAEVTTVPALSAKHIQVFGNLILKLREIERQLEHDISGWKPSIHVENHPLLREWVARYTEEGEPLDYYEYIYHRLTEDEVAMDHSLPFEVVHTLSTLGYALQDWIDQSVIGH